MALREHIDRALTLALLGWMEMEPGSTADTAYGPVARFDFATTPPYRQRVRPVSWGPTGARATTGAHDSRLAVEGVVGAL